MNNVNNTPPYYNAIEREILGLSYPVVLEKNGTYTLSPIQENRAYRLNTDNDGEYYLFEYRSGEGWDKYIGGNGMLVYHIDKSKRYLGRWGEANTVNAYQSHQCADLIEADGRTDAITEDSYRTAFSNISGVFFPYNSIKSLTPTSSPGIRFWSGRPGEVSITNIEKKNGCITFSVVGYTGSVTPPTVSSVRSESFMDAAIINFDSNTAYDGPATVLWGLTGKEMQETTVMPYQPGKYSITLENLAPGNKTYSVRIYFKVDDISGASTDVSFMTTKASAVEWPYIFIGKNKTDKNGKFRKDTKIALRTYNTSEAEAIEWTFNDNEIAPEGNGYYIVQESGTLKATVYWKDGSKDIIEKKINISEEE